MKSIKLCVLLSLPFHFISVRLKLLFLIFPQLKYFSIVYSSFSKSQQYQYYTMPWYSNIILYLWYSPSLHCWLAIARTPLGPIYEKISNPIKQSHFVYLLVLLLNVLLPNVILTYPLSLSISIKWRNGAHIQL